jgi:hypothetical protein
MSEQDFSFRLKNSRSSRLTLYLEPWGEVYQLKPGTQVQVQAKGPVASPPNNSLEISIDEDNITLWGWSGSGVTVSNA